MEPLSLFVGFVLLLDGLKRIINLRARAMPGSEVPDDSRHPL